MVARCDLCCARSQVTSDHRVVSWEHQRVHVSPLALRLPSIAAAEPPSASLSELQSLPLLKIAQRISCSNSKNRKDLNALS
jgi:hypothetical protein